MAQGEAERPAGTDSAARAGKTCVAAEGGTIAEYGGGASKGTATDAPDCSGDANGLSRPRVAGAESEDSTLRTAAEEASAACSAREHGGGGPNTTGNAGAGPAEAAGASAAAPGPRAEGRWSLHQAGKAAAAIGAAAPGAAARPGTVRPGAAARGATERGADTAPRTIRMRSAMDKQKDKMGEELTHEVHDLGLAHLRWEVEQERRVVKDRLCDVQTSRLSTLHPEKANLPLLQLGGRHHTTHQQRHSSSSSGTRSSSRRNTAAHQRRR